jgi:hypothetical protein
MSVGRLMNKVKVYILLVVEQQQMQPPPEQQQPAAAPLFANKAETHRQTGVGENTTTSNYIDHAREPAWRHANCFVLCDNYTVRSMYPSMYD